MLLCVFFLVSAKMLNIFKNPTAEELYRMVLAKKVTYEEIRRIDANKFVDLELTMRMLYDHSSIGASTQSSAKPSMGSRILSNEIPPPNASLREPQKPPAPTKQKKGSDNSASLSTKTRKREHKNQTTKKAVVQAEKVPK